MEKTDEELVQLSQIGDKNALNELTQRFITYIETIYNSEIELKNYNKELFIEAGAFGFAKAVFSYKYTKNATFKTYANKCIKNEMLGVFRANKAYSKMISLQTEYEDGLTLEDMIACDDSFEDKILFNIDFQIITKHLNMLPERKKQMIIMFYGLDGKNYTVSELQKIFNCTKDVVNNEIYIGLKKIRKSLSKELGYEIVKPKTRERKKLSK